jgi:hypothetical protein
VRVLPLENDDILLCFVNFLPVLGVDVTDSVLFSLVLSSSWLLDRSIPGEN